MPIRLPQQLPANFGGRFSPAILDAYPTCIALEDSILKKSYAEKLDLVYIRILGYLILYGPQDQARVTVANEVNSCETDADILVLGKQYYSYFIRAFRSNKGSTLPTPSSHVSRPSFDTIREMVANVLIDAPQNHATAKTQALVRDGFRCLVTKRWDTASALHNREIEQIVLSQGIPTTATHCAHIFPESTNANISRTTDQGYKCDYAASVWAVLDRFGYRKICEELNGAAVHRLDNIMTLDSNVHKQFDELNLWFEATPEKDTYKLQSPYPLVLLGLPERVTFTSTNPDQRPVPNPEYLHLHATCAKIAHLSGASEYIDDILREMESTCVLASDGGSGQILDHLFSTLPSGNAV